MITYKRKKQSNVEDYLVLHGLKKYLFFFGYTVLICDITDRVSVIFVLSILLHRLRDHKIKLVKNPTRYIYVYMCKHEKHNYVERENHLFLVCNKKRKKIKCLFHRSTRKNQLKLFTDQN